MDIRESGKKRLVVRVDNEAERKALVAVRPKFYLYISLGIGEASANDKFLDLSDIEEAEIKYPFELEMSLRSLKRMGKNLANLNSRSISEEEAFGRIAISSTIEDFLKGRAET
jgi:hypothetical protein